MQRLAVIGYSEDMNNNNVLTAGMGDQVRVTQVDMYGYLGRDFHPKRHHNGRVATVTRVELVEHNEEDDEIIYHVVTSTGQRLELMGHEIELDRFIAPEFPEYSSL